ncbi:MAG TPA: PVC-type heme-binding CxxCH protein [Planctomycetota bacterium]|nr:PVC-type heme-binding CxxCH protein [Planctomycetota bacterium]
MNFLFSLALLAQSAPFTPEEAPGKMTVPEGFKVQLFAGEPDIVQPIAFTFDDRGRLWVVECVSYPRWLPPGQEGHDRIVIFEDSVGDGKFHTKKVFADKLANVSGLALGHGGVWLTALPYLLFIPVRNGEDAPAGPAEIVLDGWDMKAKHNVFNKPSWGPDGWLYGLNGILSNSKVGKPGAPDSERLPINCGVWRLHPRTRQFEVVCTGTTNPWGIDWDEAGRGFITNCVIKHVFQVIPGAHYDRMFGEDKSAPNLYGLIPSCADHIHWAGGAWQDARGQEKHSEAGGGHAHVGAMVYLGDNWPDSYRGHLFTMNLHGHRMSHDVFEPQGSGVVARHAKDFLMGNDPWFRGLDCQYGPDGGVFVTDWTDTGECHNYDKVDTTNGRIYKITYGDPKPVAVDLGARSSADLVLLLGHKNRWYVRHALRLLQERRQAVDQEPRVLSSLRAMLEAPGHRPDEALHALWALHGCGQLSPALQLETLSSPHEHVRAWTVTLDLEGGTASPAILEKLAELAKSDPSPVVRLALASGLQRLPVLQRAAIAEALMGHEEDSSDAQLPLMIWYAIEPLVSSDRERAVGLIAKAKIPQVRQFITRRLASLAK